MRQKQSGGNKKTSRKRKAKENFVKNKFMIYMQKKLVVLVTLVLLAFVGLSIRLYVLVRDNGDSYSRQILSQQAYDSMTLPYKRGDIIDRNGTVLATSQKVYNVIIDSKMILSKENYLEPTVQALASCFDVDAGAIREYIISHESSQYYVLKRRLSYEEISDFVELQNDTKNNPDIQGVWFETEYQRIYPYTTLACDILGFTGADNEGMYGLEQYYNDQLNGSNGRQYGYLNDDSALERTTIAAQDGHTLVSTIDVNIQSSVERVLKEFNDAHENEYREGLGAYNTGCIIMNPNNGDIYAMASYPNYDVNDPYNLQYAYTQEAIDAMEDEEFRTAVNELWQNFCISSSFEPGSTMKPFTIATGLETGALTGNETYFCEGYLDIGDYTIHCHQRYGHGTIDVRGAMENSCNVALMYMGRAIGKRDFLKYQQAFNFGLRTNIDLAGETRTDSLIHTERTMGETELATDSFGQGFNVTMIQLVTAYCSLINGGYYYEPHMVDRILNADGAVVQNIEPRILRQTVSATTSAQILDYCNAVVETGTGGSARPAGYSMGGKTGTAETLPRDNGQYVVSFIGYVPADDPQLVIYVVVDRPNQAKQDNSRLATGIVREILTDILPYLGIPMTEELTDAERAELDQRHITVPGSSNTDEDDDGDGEDGQGDGTGEDGDGNTSGDNNGDGGQGDRDLNIQYDPDTGYAIDPATGEFLDPQTGEPIDPNSSFMTPRE